MTFQKSKKMEDIVFFQLKLSSELKLVLKNPKPGFAKICLILILLIGPNILTN